MSIRIDLPNFVTCYVCKEGDEGVHKLSSQLRRRFIDCTWDYETLAQLIEKGPGEEIPGIEDDPRTASMETITAWKHDIETLCTTFDRAREQFWSEVREMDDVPNDEQLTVVVNQDAECFVTTVATARLLPMKDLVRVDDC